MEIADALNVSQRPTPLAARDKINEILQSSADTKDLCIVGVKFNANIREVEKLYSSYIVLSRHLSIPSGFSTWSNYIGLVETILVIFIIT